MGNYFELIKEYNIPQIKQIIRKKKYSFFKIRSDFDANSNERRMKGKRESEKKDLV